MLAVILVRSAVEVLEYLEWNIYIQKYAIKPK